MEEKRYPCIDELGMTRNAMIQEGLKYLEFEFDGICECSAMDDATDADKELANAVVLIREYFKWVLQEE